MRMKRELSLPEAPRSLLLSKKATQEILDISLGKSRSVVSPETQSHRFHQGWQHLQDLPENILNNNVKNENLNANNNLDDVTLELPSDPDLKAESAYSCRDESDESGSSSEDEDSSVTFSDTSPLLDVSSLDSSSSSNSSSDTEMSDEGDCLQDNDNYDNNNCGDSVDESHSMDSSWMSFSSVTSAESPEQKPSVAAGSHREGPARRNGVVLPDVLPIDAPKHEDEAARDRKELELQLKRRELKLDATPRIPRECCIVEITTQPDIQVDIRLNPAPARPFSEPYIKQRNTYPSDATKNYNFYFKARDVETQCSKAVKSALSSTPRDKSSPHYFAIGEGVRLNNFTIVNGFKTLSLTELVKSNDIVKESSQKNSLESGARFAIENSSQTDITQSSFRRSIENSVLPSDDPNLTSKSSMRFRKEYVALEQKPRADVVKPIHSSSLKSSEKNGPFDAPSENGRSKPSETFVKYAEPNRVSKTVVNSSSNSPQYLHRQKTSQSVTVTDRKEASATKTTSAKSVDFKLTSPELFEVYTMETAVPQWATAARSNRENEWMKKRQNDREEIRRKLAMDSDNEDYVAEKASQHQDGASIDRLKGGSNLQICFLNETAKDQCIPEAGPPSPPPPVSQEAPQKPVPRILKRNLLFPPALPKCAMNLSKLQNNNNATQPQVTKRQRPTFFFNRPRSWHAAKVEEKRDPAEDLFTCHLRLQEEAREALAQAKEMARMQMEIERQKKKKSPIADIVGIAFPDGHNLLSRHALLDMNVAQLQVIVNDLHSQIETLNEDLVKFLLERDDLHMEQDSMLVDIEDLTRYLGLKGNSTVTHPPDSKLSANFQSNPSTKN